MRIYKTMAATVKYL